jgi:proteasome-associated ATPase
MGADTTRKRRDLPEKQKTGEVPSAENEGKRGESLEENVSREDLLERIRTSENQRLLLAEALHASRGRVRNLASADAEDERALPFGVFVRPGRYPATAIIKYGGRLYEAKTLLHEAKEETDSGTGTRRGTRRQAVSRSKPRKGEFVLLNNNLQVIEPRGFDLFSGAVGTVQQILDDERLLVGTVGEEAVVVSRADPLRNHPIRPGDSIEYDQESLFGHHVLPKNVADRLTLERVPDVGYESIGGLEEAIELIRDAIELPHLYPEYFEEHRLLPPKGILLYGPPGCGKTLVAKAVAHSLAKNIEERIGERGESFFLNVKGPELLSKYVGETEQAIRDLFARARDRSSYKSPVIVFFDEMDSLFRVRGSGISSDMESTIVPQFLSELDGLESLENVIVIGATNREDLIDPAVLRPGRLDRKIRIPRPDQRAAVEIFSKYLIPELPLASSAAESSGDEEEAAAWMIGRIVEEMYSTSPENQLLEITYAAGTKEILYLRDFNSGAIIENIVNRAKLAAVKNLIESGQKGITLDHLLESMRQEFKENEDLPHNANPSEWYRIIGRGGERVVRIRSLLGEDAKNFEAESKAKEVVQVTEKLK